MTTPSPHVFTSSRHFHDSKREWWATLPKLKYTEDELVPDSPSLFLGDLDLSFGGKQGVFYTFGNCFYYHRQVLNGGPLVGYGKILNPHVGALFVLLDDLQGLASGGYCVTKIMELTILPGFEFADQDFAFTCPVTVKALPSGGDEITTRIELVDMRNNQVVVKSSAIFVRTPAIIKMMTSQMDQDIDMLWAKAAPLRLAGEHPTDPKLAFRLTLPRPVDMEHELPSWWDASVVRAAPIKSVFEGKFELYNVEKQQTSSSVRAVVFPQLTAEGPPTLFHGGGGASCAIEVLRNLRPDLQVERIVLKFKRPIHVTNKIAVEWVKKKKDDEWTAQILDWNKNVAQEIVLVEKKIGSAKM